MGADLGGNLEGLDPETPLAALDWTSRDRSGSDNKDPQNWLNFILKHAEIEGVDTMDLNGKTLGDFINRLLTSNKN